MNSVIVTGAGSGIGRATAMALASRGIKVLAVGRREAPLLETREAAPGLIDAASLDISDPDARAELIRLGRRMNADGLVHAAGTFPIEPLSAITLAGWRAVFSTNLEARLFLSQGLAGTLGPEGRILFIGSMSATTPRKGATAYCASKAASFMLQECLKKEFADQGPSVGISIPGPVKTDMVTRGIAADPDIFPDGAGYDAGPLVAPETVGTYLAWLMAETDAHEFSQGQWDIRNEAHHHRWLGAQPFYLPAG